MQYKNLFISAFLLALTLPLQVLGEYGRISYYESGPTTSNPGACGTEFIYDYYIALNSIQLDPKKSYYCGQCVKVVYKNKYIVGRISDRCYGCPNEGLDVSPAMFDHFVGRSNRELVGVVKANWSIVSCDLYGQKGECSGSNCGGESGHKTTTTKITTTTTTTTQTHSTTTQSESTTTETQAVETPVNEKSDKAEKTKEANKDSKSEINPAFGNSDKAAPKENKEGGNAGYVVPITGAIMVSGAAGIGLLYMKRENRYENISSQIKSITRSITTRGSSIGRSFTRSLTTRGSSLGRRVTRSITRKKPTQPTLPTTNVSSQVIDVNQPTEVLN